MLRRLLGLFRSRSKTERRSKPPTASEVDNTLSRIMQEINAPMDDLRGDSVKLEALIHRIEATTRRGAAVMKGAPP